MKFLVVEGNTVATRNERAAYGIQPYFEMFRDLLYCINPQAKIDTAFPADRSNDLPNQQKLKSYNGILYTGSSLSVLDNKPEVQNQLNFAESLFASGIPFYGSCWGLQVATVVAGGRVGKGEKGLELGMTQSIKLTEAGKKSRFFKNRKHPFHALCIHYDEVLKTPENASILAYNDHSKVQAISFNYLKSSFFGVQYHPEFKPSDMGLIISFLSKKLVQSNYFSSPQDSIDFSSRFTEQKNLPLEILNYKSHLQDITSWIKTSCT